MPSCAAPPTRTLNFSLNHPRILIIAWLLSALSMPAPAQQKQVAHTVAMAEPMSGKATLARATKITGTVEAVDLMQRRVVLKGRKGRVLPLTAGPDVRNLAQVKVGDRVTVRYLDALSLTLRKDGKELRSSVQTEDAARAAAGDWPAGTVAQQVEVTADVIAVHTWAKTVTLRGPKQVVDLKLRDPGQMRLIKVGDQIHAVYAEALALSVDPAAPAKK